MKTSGKNIQTVRGSAKPEPLNKLWKSEGMENLVRRYLYNGKKRMPQNLNREIDARIFSDNTKEFFSIVQRIISKIDDDELRKAFAEKINRRMYVSWNNFKKDNPSNSGELQGLMDSAKKEFSTDNNFPAREKIPFIWEKNTVTDKKENQKAVQGKYCDKRLYWTGTLDIAEHERMAEQNNYVIAADKNDLIKHPNSTLLIFEIHLQSLILPVVHKNLLTLSILLHRLHNLGLLEAVNPKHAICEEIENHALDEKGKPIHGRLSRLWSDFMKTNIYSEKDNEKYFGKNKALWNVVSRIIAGILEK